MNNKVWWIESPLFRLFITFDAKAAETGGCFIDDDSTHFIISIHVANLLAISVIWYGA